MFKKYNCSNFQIVKGAKFSREPNFANYKEKMVFWGNLIYDIHKKLSVSSINNSKKFCQYNICGQNIFSCLSLLNTKIYMFFTVGQKYHKYHCWPLFVNQFYFSDFFLNFSRGLNFANVNFRDMSCKINFEEKVEIQSAPLNHFTQGM